MSRNPVARCHRSLAGNVMSDRRYSSNMCEVENGSGQSKVT